MKEYFLINLKNLFEVLIQGLKPTVVPINNLIVSAPEKYKLANGNCGCAAAVGVRKFIVLIDF